MKKYNTVICDNWNSIIDGSQHHNFQFLNFKVQDLHTLCHLLFKEYLSNLWWVKEPLACPSCPHPLLNLYHPFHLFSPSTFSLSFLNQHAWFPEIFFRKVCVCVCLYVCMYICLSFRTHVSKPFTWSLKAACIQSLKG